MLKIWPKVKVMTLSERGILHTSRPVSPAWSHRWCLYRSNLSLSKAIAEKLLVTFHDLKWPRQHEEGNWSQYPIQVVKSTYSPIFECFEWFCPEQATFNFLPLTYLRGRKIDLIFGHRYHNYEITDLLILLRISIAESFKVIGHSV